MCSEAPWWESWLSVAMGGDCWWCHGECRKLCAGCLVARYCSAECQERAWNGHKRACKRTQRARAKWRSLMEQLGIYAKRRLVVVDIGGGTTDLTLLCLR